MAAVTTVSYSPHLLCVHPNLPDTPTVAESLPGFLTGSWQGVMAPAGAPPELIARLQAELARILHSSDIIVLNLEF